MNFNSQVIASASFKEMYHLESQTQPSNSSPRVNPSLMLTQQTHPHGPGLIAAPKMKYILVYQWDHQ